MKAISPKEESGVTQRDIDTFSMLMKMLFAICWSVEQEHWNLGV